MNIISKSKELAYLLRHDRDYDFDGHGWRDVGDLILRHGFTQSLLEEIVATDNKRRYEFNEDHTKIRARQGHSVRVDVEFKEAVPPDTLYHGTSEDVAGTILKEGLKPGSRLHVHLSTDMETAMKVGMRHGKPVVLKIDTATMNDDGIRFHISANEVWLTDFVPPRYISVVNTC